jgi:lipopolysaccharide/colanic/teichoic acid biosynthesis glycosyltransferase
MAAGGPSGTCCLVSVAGRVLGRSLVGGGRTFALRFLDLAIAPIFVLAAFPIFVVAALAVFLEDGRPLIYRQERVGRDGKLFTILKLRTMKRDAEQDGPAFADIDDPRVLRCGRTIRALHLDELPQLLNVLAGDMSLVGPRPERPVFVEEYRRQVIGYDRRHSVRPGITGVAQLQSDYHSDPFTKLAGDLEFVERPTVGHYLSLLARTPFVVITYWRHPPLPTTAVGRPSSPHSPSPTPATEVEDCQDSASPQ